MTRPPGSDLTGLFRPPPGVEPFRQGEVVTFDAADGSNTIRVGGAVLADLPLLNIGDTVNLQAGDAVILMRCWSSWAILGRIITPGAAALTSAVDFFAGGDSVLTPWTITSSFTTQGSVTIPTPEWANSFLVSAISTVAVTNSGGSGEAVRVITDINGGGGGETIQNVPNDSGFITTFAPVARQLGEGSGFALGTETVVDVRVKSNGANLNGQYTFLNVTGTFRKV